MANIYLCAKVTTLRKCMLYVYVLGLTFLIHGYISQVFRGFYVTMADHMLKVL